MLEIRPAREGERLRVAHFLHHSFKRKIPLERWQALIDGRWSRQGDGYGVSLMDGDELVGFLGVVHAERPLAGGGTARTGSLTSWYLRAPYRGRGLALEMLLQATSEPAVTYLAIDSVPKALNLMQKAGLGLLDDRRLVWRSDGKPVDGLQVTPLGEVLPDVLSAFERRIIEDHKGLAAEALLIQAPGDGHCLMMRAVKRKCDDYVTHEVLCLSDPEFFARHARAIARALLPAKDAVLTADWRFLGAAAGADAIEEISGPRYFTSGFIAPRQVDYLYSETVLLDLKLS